MSAKNSPSIQSKDAQGVLSNTFEEAISFYQLKVASNKRRLFYWSQFSLLLFWIGGGILALIAYGGLDPLLGLLGRESTSTTYFYIFKTPQTFPTMCIAAAAVIGATIRKRGYLNAWVRSSLILTEITLLKAKTDAAIAAYEGETPDSIALKALDDVQRLILVERKAWATTTAQDLTALFSIKTQAE